MQAVGTSLPSACFLIRVFGGVFLMQIKAAPRVTLPGGLSPCVSSSFLPPRQGGEAQPLAPHSGQHLGCSAGMGAEGCH